MKHTLLRTALALTCLWLVVTANGAPAGDGPNNLPGAGSASMNRPDTILGEESHAIPITGKAMLDNGTAPSEMVLIERVCDGRVYPVAYTNSRGHFSFVLGQAMDSFADSSDSTKMGQRSVARTGGNDMNCEVRAVLAGFRSDSISLLNHRYMDNPDIGTIVLHRLANVEGFTISATSGLAPKEARKAYEKGLESMRKQRPDEASRDFAKAVELYPKYAAAWYALGTVYEQRDHPGQAREAYTRAVTADPKYIPPYERLYLLAVRDSNWQEVAETTDQVMRLDPIDFPSAYYFNAAANLQLDKLDVAEKNARRALELDTAHRNPKTSYVLGLILAKKRDFAKSAELLRGYLNIAPNDPNASRIREQLGQIEKFVRPKDSAAQK